MRIQSQREAFAYRIASAFDWRLTHEGRPWHDNLDQNYEVHSAPLENGHELHAWKDTSEPKSSWEWAITHPRNAASKEYSKKWTPENLWDGPPRDHPWRQSEEWNPPQPLVSEYLAAAGPESKYNVRCFDRWLPDHEPPVLVHSDHIPSLGHAKQQAEEAYQKMFPLGTNTGGHESGNDYSDLNSFKDFL